MPTQPRERTAAAPQEKCCRGPGDLRCGCGSLLAKVVSGAVELKCRRCKRMWRVPLQNVQPAPGSLGREAGPRVAGA